MGKRGPLPKSKALKAAQGNPGHEKRDTSAPAAAPAPVVTPSAALAPAWLSKEERTLWDKVTPELTRLQLLAMPDAIAFGRYVQWLNRYLELNRKTRRNPVVRETKSEHVTMQRLDKAFQALATIDKQLLQYEDRFGMNPRERFAIMARLAGERAPAMPTRPHAPTRADGPEAGDQPAPTVAPAAKRSPVGLLAGRNKSHLN